MAEEHEAYNHLISLPEFNMSANKDENEEQKILSYPTPVPSPRQAPQSPELSTKAVQASVTNLSLNEVQR